MEHQFTICIFAFCILQFSIGVREFRDSVNKPVSEGTLGDHVRHVTSLVPNEAGMEKGQMAGISQAGNIFLPPAAGLR